MASILIKEKKIKIMYELYYNGQLEGLFTSEEAAKTYAENNKLGTYSIFPPNTMTNQPEYAE